MENKLVFEVTVKEILIHKIEVEAYSQSGAESLAENRVLSGNSFPIEIGIVESIDSKQL